MATVTVLGRGTATAQPDQVVVAFAITAVAEEPGAAFAEVADRTAALEAVLDEHRVPETHRTTSRIGVSEQRDYDAESAARVRHRATNSLTIRLDDVGGLGPLMSAAVERAQAHVHGPSWRLADPEPLRLESCRLAAVDARRRAQAYADALGLRLGGVEEVSERGTPSFPVAGAARMAVAEVPVHEPGLELVTTVEVTFLVEEA